MKEDKKDPARNAAQGVAGGEKEKSVKPSTLVYSLLLVIGLFLLATGLMIYQFRLNNRFTQMVTKITPYPAAVINSTDFIPVRTLQNDLVSVRRFYENQDFSEIGLRVDFKTADGQKRLKINEKNLLNKLIENEVIKQLAEKRGIKVSSGVVAQEVERKINQSGNRDVFLADMKKLYGWGIGEFEEKIVKPDMYREQLKKSVRENDQEMSSAKKKADEAKKELDKKTDFSEVAKKFSDGESAKNGGDLGWLSTDQMIPEIAVAAALLDKGERSSIIESALGFHIIRVDDKKNENGTDKVKLSQVFIKSKNFADWLFEQEKSFKIYIPLKDFYWDEKTQSVQFERQDLRDFEDNLEKNSPDDISVLF